MAVSRDAGKGKNYEGPVHGGEGKQNLQGHPAYEYIGVHKSAPNPKLSPAVGYTSKRDGTEEQGFSLAGKGYEGPENWHPTNLGTRKPDDLEHS